VPSTLHSRPDAAATDAANTDAGHPMALTADEMAQALRARADGLAWERIAASYGLSREGLRRQIDPAYRAQRNAYQRAHMRRRRERIGDAARSASQSPVRRRVLQRAISGPPPGMSLTAWICGDRPPGRPRTDERDQIG
jgi:hypothetical protein